MTYNDIPLDQMTPKQRYYWKNRDRIIEEQKQRYYEKNKDKIDQRRNQIEENKRLVYQQKIEQKKLKEEISKAIKDLEFLEAKEVIENKFNTTFLEAIPNLSYNELETLFIKAACDCRSGELEEILKKKVMSMVNN